MLNIFSFGFRHIKCVWISKRLKLFLIILFYSGFHFIDWMMCDASEGHDHTDELRLEITRLQAELEEASSDKMRAAEYGLAVLEEKNMLQQHCDQLESLYESTLHDLKCTKEVCLNDNV